MQVDTFNEIVDPSGQSDEDSYKALTALGILAAIQSLVKATFNETQVYYKFYGLSEILYSGLFL